MFNSQSPRSLAGLAGGHSSTRGRAQLLSYVVVCSIEAIEAFSWIWHKLDVDNDCIEYWLWKILLDGGYT
jgi:hypothetical protein